MAETFVHRCHLCHEELKQIHTGVWPEWTHVDSEGRPTSYCPAMAKMFENNLERMSR